MTSDEFIAWAMEQPETEHYELIDGEVVAREPERSGHSLTKFHIARRLAEAVEAGNLPCRVYPDAWLSRWTTTRCTNQMPLCVVASNCRPRPSEWPIR
jgi:Uma2 family endonuclease